MNERFGKKYKLCSQKQIQTVFDSKTTVKAYPFIVHYAIQTLSETVPFQITVSAPKRNFKKAHDRNRIKRLMRESIRKNKLILESFLTEHEKQVALFMIYTAREELTFELINKKTIQLFQQITNELKNENNQ